MKIDFWGKEGAVLLTRPGGESLKISVLEFWEICRFGARLDVEEEVARYLEDGGVFAGVDADTIKESPDFVSEVVERVMDSRASNENGDQIYDALCYCVKYGKNKDTLLAGSEKSLEDMYEDDFKDADRRNEFGKLIREFRVLQFELSALNASPQGGARKDVGEIEQRLGDVVYNMDLLRVKEWLSQQPFDLDTTSARYQEAKDMMTEICEHYFPELAETVFCDPADKFPDGDFLFREPDMSGMNVWYYYNPDAVSGGQIVAVPFDKSEAVMMATSSDPLAVLDGRTSWLHDIDKKSFFEAVSEMIWMKQEGHYLGSDIKEVCREIAGDEYCLPDSARASLGDVLSDAELRSGKTGVDSNRELEQSLT